MYACFYAPDQQKVQHRSDVKNQLHKGPRRRAQAPIMGAVERFYYVWHMILFAFYLHMIGVFPCIIWI